MNKKPNEEDEGSMTYNNDLSSQSNLALYDPSMVTTSLPFSRFCEMKVLTSNLFFFLCPLTLKKEHFSLLFSTIIFVYWSSFLSSSFIFSFIFSPSSSLSSLWSHFYLSSTPLRPYNYTPSLSLSLSIISSSCTKQWSSLLSLSHFLIGHFLFFFFFLWQSFHFINHLLRYCRNRIRLSLLPRLWCKNWPWFKYEYRLCDH